MSSYTLSRERFAMRKSRNPAVATLDCSTSAHATDSTHTAHTAHTTRARAQMLSSQLCSRTPHSVTTFHDHCALDFDTVLCSCL